MRLHLGTTEEAAVRGLDRQQEYAASGWTRVYFAVLDDNLRPSPQLHERKLRRAANFVSYSFTAPDWGGCRVVSGGNMQRLPATVAVAAMSGAAACDNGAVLTCVAAVLLPTARVGHPGASAGHSFPLYEPVGLRIIKMRSKRCLLLMAFISEACGLE